MVVYVCLYVIITIITPEPIVNPLVGVVRVDQHIPHAGHERRGQTLLTAVTYGQGRHKASQIKLDCSGSRIAITCFHTKTFHAISGSSLFIAFIRAIVTVHVLE